MSLQPTVFLPKLSDRYLEAAVFNAASVPLPCLGKCVLYLSGGSHQLDLHDSNHIRVAPYDASGSGKLRRFAHEYLEKGHARGKVVLKVQ